MSVRLSADVSGFQAAMGKAQASADRLASKLGQASQTQEWRATSTTLMAMGASLTAVTAIAAKSAISWESAFAGVRKTVDGTDAQLLTLEGTLRSMAREMPTAHKEIASVAEAAGQLGVAGEDVASFSRVMIQLGETTNLSADTAATSIAQFTNIMGTSRSEVDRLGATLVKLGNNGASTEADIMALSHRLAGVGAQMNMTEADVMGFANAMASVGIEAEAGGTAMTLTLKGVDAAVRSGGSNLQTYARVAGMSAEQFAQAWGTDAAGATAAFVEGLGRMKGSGEDMNAVLDELGINGIRQSDTLIRLAGATTGAGAANDLLRDSLDMAAEAWAENSALTDEYGKRVETTEAQIQIAWNSIKDAAIGAGQSTLPAISGMAGAVANLAELAGSAPPYLQAFGVGVAGIGGAALLAVGGLMKGITFVSSFRSALDEMGPSAQDAVGKLGAVGKFAGIAAVGFMALAAAGSAIQSNIDKSRMSLEEAEVSLRHFGRTGQASADLTNSFAAALSGTAVGTDHMVEGLRMLNDYGGTGAETLENLIMGVAGMQGNVSMLREEVGKLDAALASMDSDDAALAFSRLRDQMELAGYSVQDMADALPQYRASLEATAQSLGVTSLSTEELVDWMEGIEPSAVTAAKALADMGMVHLDAAASAEEQAKALLGLIEMQDAAAQSALNASNSEIAYADQLAETMKASEELTEAIKDGTLRIDEQTGKIDLSTEAGRRAQGSLNDLAGAALRNRDAMLANGASVDVVNQSTATARGEFIRAATQMGLNETQANDLADAYGLIPTTVTTNVTAPGATTSYEQAEALFQSLQRLPPEVQSNIVTQWQRYGFDAAVGALAAENGREYINYLRTIATVPIASGNPYGGGGVLVASGGYITGPGTATSDSIPAWLSNGEYVQRAAAVDYYGVDFMSKLNAMRIPRDGLPRFADGGPVARYMPTSTVPQWAASAASTAPQVNHYSVSMTVPVRDLAELRSMEDFFAMARVKTRMQGVSA